MNYKIAVWFAFLNNDKRSFLTLFAIFKRVNRIISNKRQSREFAPSSLFAMLFLAKLNFGVVPLKKAVATNKPDAMQIKTIARRMFFCRFHLFHLFIT